METESGNEEPDIIEPQYQAGQGRRSVSTSKMPLRDADGTVVGLVGVFDDITEFKNLQEDLRVARERAEASKLVRTRVLKEFEREVQQHLFGQATPFDFLFEPTSQSVTEIASHLRHASGQRRVDLPTLGSRRKNSEQRIIVVWTSEDHAQPSSQPGLGS